ncbi:MAG: ArnT family glycosyltransferase [Cyclobacteriaceae bacterium]
MEQEEWIVPTFNNQLRTDKPILHYYFMRLGYMIFGVNALGARFFSAVFGVLLLLLSYYFSSKILDKKTAWYQSLILLASLQFIVQFRLAVPDPYLIVFLYLTFIYVFKGLEEQKNILYAYIFAAFGFLTKGLIAIVLPGIVAIVYLLWTKRFTFSTLKTLRIPEGLLIFLCIGLPWYIAVGVKTKGEWLNGFFLKHNLERYTSTMEGHHGFFLLPFLLIVVALLPYSLFAFPAIRKIFKAETAPFIKYALVVVVVIGLFFSFSKTMLPTYIGPAIPFLAVILGSYLSMTKPPSIKKYKPQIIHLIFIIALLIPLGSYFAIEGQAKMKHLSYLAIYLLPITFGSVLAWFFWYKENKSAAVISLTSAWGVGAIMFFSMIWPKLYVENPVHNSSHIWKEYDEIVAYKQFNPAFVWSAGKAIPVYDDLLSLEKALKDGKVNTIIISRSKFKDELIQLKKIEIIYEKNDLFEGSKTILLKY